MGSVAGEEHPAGTVVPSLAALAQEPRAPAQLLHTEVGADNAGEGVTHLLDRQRRGQGCVLAQPVPRDGAIPAIAERHHDHGAVDVRAREHGLLGRVSELDVSKHDVGLVLVPDEVDAQQIPDRAVRSVATHDIVGRHGCAVP